MYLQDRTNNVRSTTPVSRVVTVTAATAYLNVNDHDGKTVVVDAAAGCAIRLPAARGTGAQLRILIGTTITSNSTTIKVANATDVLVGFVFQAQPAGNTVSAFETASTDDTITFNGTTTGGIKGDIVELTDIRAGFWSLQAITAATGTTATPLSATVS